MRSRREQQDPVEPAAYRELRLLSAVEDKPEATQRELSQRVGIALGLTNVLLRNLAQKGYLRASQAHWKRWLYALTPEGFSHKLRLTVAYLHRVLDHYQTVRQTLRQELEPLALHEESRVAIYGTGEFAELVYLGLKELEIEEIDVFASMDGVSGRFLGMQVQDVATLRAEKYDRILIALLGGSAAVEAELRQQGAGQEKVVTFFGVDGDREEAQWPPNGT